MRLRNFCFLGDIPFLGLGFKNTDNEIRKKELVIFLTPHIISGAVDYLQETVTSPPVGEEIFTIPESMTFERRNPQEVDPTYLNKVTISGQASPQDTTQIQ